MFEYNSHMKFECDCVHLILLNIIYLLFIKHLFNPLEFSSGIFKGSYIDNLLKWEFHIIL
jgi:hypothetical protein